MLLKLSILSNLPFRANFGIKWNVLFFQFPNVSQKDTFSVSKCVCHFAFGKQILINCLNNILCKLIYYQI